MAGGVVEGSSTVNVLDVQANASLDNYLNNAILLRDTRVVNWSAAISVLSRIEMGREGNDL